MESKQKTLGQTLKECRDLCSFTLRQVEDATGVSNAYLSQLENDKIKKPSANVLYKLANIYGINLEVLFFAAGIIQQEQYLAEQKIKIGAFVLTKSEEEELIEYLLFLRNKKRNHDK